MTSQAPISEIRRTNREERVRAAFYRGESLTLSNLDYLHAFDGLAGELLRQDTSLGDLTVEALGIGGRKCVVEIRSKEKGIAAGVEEAKWFYERAGLAVPIGMRDGDPVDAGDVLLRTEGSVGVLLVLERSVVNLMQRMSGIATATRNLVNRIAQHSPAVHVVATRKTPWGLLDKRAVHLGGGGTHRLNLGDAILIKTNHLRLALANESADFESRIARAWENRKKSAFFEVEVTAVEEAVAVARALRRSQMQDDSCPCVLMLDNFSVEQAAAAIAELRNRHLHEFVLVEASGNIDEDSLDAYASTGVDVISIGALTHSARALDLSARLIPESR